MVEALGLEPRMTESKSVVLPLHHASTGAPTTIWTQDPRITSAVLYQLSYKGMGLVMQTGLATPCSLLLLHCLNILVLGRRIELLLQGWKPWVLTDRRTEYKTFWRWWQDSNLHYTDLQSGTYPFGSHHHGGKYRTRTYAPNFSDDGLAIRCITTLPTFHIETHSPAANGSIAVTVELCFNALQYGGGIAESNSNRLRSPPVFKTEPGPAWITLHW